MLSNQQPIGCIQRTWMEHISVSFRTCISGYTSDIKGSHWCHDSPRNCWYCWTWVLMSDRPELCCCCCCCPDPDDIPLVIPSTFCTGFSLQGDTTRLRNTGTWETDSKIWKRAHVSTSVSGRRAAASWPGVAGPPSDGAEMSSLWSAVHSSDIWNSLWNKHTKASEHLWDLNPRIMEASKHICVTLFILICSSRTYSIILEGIISV